MSVEERLRGLEQHRDELRNAMDVYPNAVKFKLPVELAGNKWTTYTPTVTASSGTITSYTAAGEYRVIGKSCRVTAHIDITTAGTGGGILRISTPFASAPSITVAGSGMIGTPNGLCVWIASGGSVINVMKYDGTGVVITGTQVYAEIEYPIA